MDIDNKQLERDIENAIRARGLKESMRQWDIEAKGAVSDRGNRGKWQKIRRMVYAVSAVAAVAAILVVVVPATTWQTTYRQLARWGYQQYAHYFLKPQPKQPAAYQCTVEELMAMAESSVTQIVNDRYEMEILGHEDLIQDAAWQIKKGNYDVAQAILEDAKELLKTDDVHYQESMDDIQYLNALCELGLNHRTKAQKALNTIAESNSRHREAAAKLAAEMR